MAQLGQNPIIYAVPSGATANTVLYLYSGITINTTPSNISASENQIVFDLSSTVVNFANDEKFRGGFGVSALPPAGSYIEFKPLSVSGSFPTYRITAADQPKHNECYSSTSTPARTLTELGQSIAYALNSNSSFRSRFCAVPIGGTCHIEALEYGARWNMTLVSATGFGAGPVITGSTPLDYKQGIDVTDADSKRDYSVWADLYIGGTGYYGGAINKQDSYRIAQMENSYSKSNSYLFDVSGALKNFVSTPIPTYGMTSMEQTTECMQNYYMVFGTKYDEFRNGYTRQFIKGQTAVNWVLNASGSLLDYNDLSLHCIDNNGAQGTLYLNSQPETKYTYYNSDEYLNILFFNEAPQIPNLEFFAYIDVYYQDGTTDVALKTIQSTLVGSDGGGYYTLDCSPYQVVTGSTLFVSSGTRRVKKYGVRLCYHTSGSASIYQVAETKYFEFIPDCATEGQKHLMWLGPKGAWETFTFNGHNELSIERKVTTFNTPIGYFPTVLDIATIVHNIDFENKNKIFSGYFNRDHFDWLVTSIGKSTDVRVRDENNSYVPIIITDVDAKCVSTDDLFQLSLEYVLGKKENYIKQ